MKPLCLFDQSPYTNLIVDENCAISEQAIIELNKKFTMCGFHYINIMATYQGKRAVYTLLKILKCYYKIAYFSLNHYNFDGAVVNIYALIHELYGISPDYETLQEFFFNPLYFNFIWIEKTAQLVAVSWYNDFEKALEESNINKCIPIIIFVNP